MPRPGVGNPGNKGGGRKSAMLEKNTADLLEEMFTGELTKNELVEKIKKGKFSVKDRFLLMAAEGNELFMQKMFDKYFPSKVEGDMTTRSVTDVLKDD